MIFKPDLFEQPSQLSPLTLAFVGDSVYELYVRTRLCHVGSMPANKLHRMAIGYVKAGAQAASYRAVAQLLTPEEEAVYKRGRNAKSPTVPKNALLSDYKSATGLEALMGYLYLKGESDRLNEIMCAAYEAAHTQAQKQAKQNV